MPKPILYVDTCVVIHATKRNCWNALAGHFDIRTVVEVSKELAKKPDIIHGYVEIDMDAFGRQSVIEQVTVEATLKAIAKNQEVTALHDGERDLLTQVFSLKFSSWLVATGDKHAVLIAFKLGLGDHLISLEEAAEKCGQNPKLDAWYSKKWLSDQKTVYLLDNI